MPAPKPSAGGVVAVRANKAFLTPPGPLGFSNLVEPDDAFDQLKFKANQHFDEAAEEILKARIAVEIDALWPAFIAMAEKQEKPEPRGGWVKPEADAWVDDHMKSPKEANKIQLPYIIFANDAEYRDKKSGKMVRKTMKAYDSAGHMLDLASLHLGMESIVQLMLTAGLFVSPLVKNPTPSFKLQGVRVIQLEQFGAGGPGLGEINEEDMGLLQGAEAQDLSAYAQSSKPQGAKSPARGGRHEEAPEDDFGDDEIPF